MEQAQTDEEHRLAGLVTGVVDSVAEVILAGLAARLGPSSLGPSSQVSDDNIVGKETEIPAAAP